MTTLVRETRGGPDPLDPLGDLDLSAVQKANIEKLVDLVQGSVGKIQRAGPVGFKSAVEEAFDDFYQICTPEFSAAVGKVSWGVQWFFTDMAKRVGYSRFDRAWEPVSCADSTIDPDGLGKLSRDELVRGLASFMANELAAEVLLLAGCSYGTDGAWLTLTSLYSVYQIGVTLDELRVADPYFQIVGPGCKWFHKQYLAGANLTQYPVVQNLRRILELPASTEKSG